MRKWLLAGTALLAAASIAVAANLPNWTSPSFNEPGQTNAALNQMNANIQRGVNGYLGGTFNIQSAATTALQTLASTIIPTNTLSVPGQGLLLRCWGFMNNQTNTRAVQLALGTNTVTVNNLTANGERWDLQLQVHLSTVPTGSDVIGQVITRASISITASQDTVDNFAGALTAACNAQDNAAESAGITLLGFVIQQIM